MSDHTISKLAVRGCTDASHRFERRAGIVGGERENGHAIERPARRNDAR
jgi:hypothetical protein